MSAGELYLREDFARHWAGQDPFAEIEALRRDPVREVASRSTFRFELDGSAYFAKVHGGVGWLEILKNLVVGKPPVVDAGNEYRAATYLAGLGLHTLKVAAFGTRGRNPARRRSFLVTDEITGAETLEDLTLDWPENPPDPVVKWALIDKSAHVASTMHDAGINHRDFYICHLMLQAPGALTRESLNFNLYLMDLHRAQQRAGVPRRWMVRDLAALLYSTYDIGLSRRDRMRFLKAYFDMPLRDVLRRHASLLAAVQARADKLYAKAQRKRLLPRQQNA